LKGLVARHPALVRRLEKFSLPSVVLPLAGLLTLPATHPANLRLSALIHLAAMYCRGDRDPTLAQLREWLNEIILKDPIAQREDPVEDVCVSNVVTWFGNARLFDGGWQENDFALESFLVAGMQLREEWMAPVLRSATALLKMSEATATRAAVPRYTLSKELPRRPLRVVHSTAGVAQEYVSFPYRELETMEIGPTSLAAFKFDEPNATALENETIGHTTLERHPLVYTREGVVLALPTAVSAAIRRLMIECAQAAGRLDALQDVIAKYQFEQVRRLGCVGWGIRELDLAEEALEFEFIGSFDEGSYVHLVFLPDTLAPVLKEGLQSIDSVADEFTKRVDEKAHAISKRPDYQRGMTLLVHGGAGRGFYAGFGEAPDQWERLILPASDFMLLAWDEEMTALRAWKLLDYEKQLLERGMYFVNVNGFMNLYGYATLQDFALVPSEMPSGGMLALGADYVTGVRHRIRTSVDKHAAILTASPGYLTVQRRQPSHYFKQAENLPIYISAAHAASGELLGCVETASRPWWVRCTQRSDNSRASSVIFQVWDLTLNWLLPVATALEGALHSLPPGPLLISLTFPQVETFAAKQGANVDPPIGPSVSVEGGEINLSCSAEYLRSFASEKNIGDRLMVKALLEGGHALADSVIAPSAVGTAVSRIVKNDQARFFHTVPADRPREMMFAALKEGAPRFVQAEDRAMSWLDLARKAGWTNPPGEVASEQANALLKRSADVAWQRIKARLLEIERASVVERALMNQYAVQRDAATWRLTAQAMLALYEDQGEVISAANNREGKRGVASLASRVIAEMAICTSLWGKGRACSDADLDYMIANMSVLLECASQSDALHYGLASRNLIVEPNGTFTFDRAFQETVHVPYIYSHGERGFRSAADDYADAFVPREIEEKELDPDFVEAFVDEFGLTPTQLLDFVYRLVSNSIEKSSATFRLSRSEVVSRLKGVGAANANLAYDALSLKPRRRWDEKRPVKAEPRDWYPWRFNRRLSLTRRPLVQLNEKADPVVLVEAALVDRSVEFLFAAYKGHLPIHLFDSPKMRAWIGKAVNDEGHSFNKTVAAAYRRLGFEAREVNITELGGPAELGDVDAFAWNTESGVVYATECKRLMFARTVAEVGERLQEYTSVAAEGEARTPIQKHSDRMTFLRSALPAVSRLTGIPVGKIILRPALVTDHLVPMQFTNAVLKFVDFVSDIEGLERKIKKG